MDQRLYCSRRQRLSDRPELSQLAAGVPAYAISRLQSALNAAARLVFSLQKYDSVTLLLQELHWLKVEQRIE